MSQRRRASQPSYKPKLASEKLDELELIYEDLLGSDSFSDFTITITDRSFKVHKSILASRSPKFRAMFNVDMKESRENVLQLDSLDSDIVGKFLRYLYTNKLELVKEDPKIRIYQAVELFNLADEYQVPGLKVICEDKLIEHFPEGTNIKIDQPSHIFDMLNLADLHGMERLKEVILKFVTTHKRSITVWEDYLKGLGSQSPELGKDILRALAETPDSGQRYCGDCGSSNYNADAWG